MLTYDYAGNINSRDAYVEINALDLAALFHWRLSACSAHWLSVNACVIQKMSFHAAVAFVTTDCLDPGYH